MLVKGTESREVKVEIKPSDVLLGLAEQYGYAAKNILNSKLDSVSKLVKREEKYFLEYYENVSYHGSPDFKKTKEWEISEESYTAIQCIKYLYNLEKKKEELKKEERRQNLCNQSY